MNQHLAARPKQNRILGSLPPEDLERFANDLELVKISLGQILYESGDTVDYVYFPTSSIISLIYSTEDGASTELAMAGHEGLIGISLVLGGEITTHRMVAQCEGYAYRMRAEIFCWELDHGRTFQRSCLCYAQAMMTHMGQSAVCHRHHTIDQQFCRWILHFLDHSLGLDLAMTQEKISNLLGVRREAVTEAAGNLQAAGLIQYCRGHITVLDRPRIEERTCECYSVVKSEYDRLFHITPSIPVQARARPDATSLRERAETHYLAIKEAMPTTSSDSAHLIEELQVHQIELEMHNEELSHAYDEAEKLREKYADIYNFAPVAYLSLNATGAIVQLNLTGAILLGIKHSQSVRHHFVNLIKPECVPIFNQFYRDVQSDKSTKNCNLILPSTSHRPEAIVRIDAVMDEEHLECRMVIIDVTYKMLPALTKHMK